MREIVAVSPFRCRIWSEHERLHEHITEESCKAEIQSFTSHGQLLPVLGRPVRNDSAYDIELVYGARRLFVARHLNVPLLVELRELSDREAIVVLDIENRQRQDVSPYERGCSYQNWLRCNYFQSQEEIARAIGISASQVSRLIKLARIPPVIVNAFRSPREICETWGLDLYEAWQDMDRRRSIARRARALVERGERPPPEKVLQELLSGCERARSNGRAMRDEVVPGFNGRALFRIRYQPRTVAFMVPAESLSSAALTRIKSALVDLLQPAMTQAAAETEDLSQRRSQMRKVLDYSVASRTSSALRSDDMVSISHQP